MEIYLFQHQLSQFVLSSLSIIPSEQWLTRSEIRIILLYPKTHEGNDINFSLQNVRLEEIEHEKQQADTYMTWKHQTVIDYRVSEETHANGRVPLKSIKASESYFVSLGNAR